VKDQVHDELPSTHSVQVGGSICTNLGRRWRSDDYFCTTSTACQILRGGRPSYTI